jgi:pimeloyl-ACP methyl ester carboxylesterase
MIATIVFCFALLVPALAIPIGNGDPEVDLKPADLIRFWGYPAEQYSVTTKDGYILPLYRIPSGKTAPESNTTRPVVYLQHGLENSAADWLINLPHQSAAFIFADAGFDVWIGNFRGTTYSKTHATLSPKDHEYWQFSWDEMAQYDLPALIEKALEISGAAQIYYVGHSMGTMTGFAKFAQDQVLAKKIKQFYALGPVLSMKHVQGPVKYAAPFTKSLKFITSILGVDEFLPNNKLQEMWAKYVCPNPLTDLICKNVLLMISGPNTHQINESRVPVINAHSPAGTSVQNVIHFGQLVNSGNFQAYDYGNAKANNKHYGTDRPPLYDVSTMQIPVTFYSGDVDWLSTPIDVSYSVSLFKNVVDNVLLTGFNHMDFVWGIKAAPLIYQPIAKSISKDFSS